MFRNKIGTAVLVTVFSLGVAWSASPAGAGGGSSVTSSQQATTLQCEKQVSAKATRIFRKIVLCYHRAASSARKGADTRLASCVQHARDSYDQGTANIFAKLACPDCMVRNAGNLRDQYERLVEQQAGLVYCDGTVPLEGGGFVPPTPLDLVCD